MNGVVVQEIASSRCYSCLEVDCHLDLRDIATNNILLSRRSGTIESGGADNCLYENAPKGMGVEIQIYSISEMRRVDLANSCIGSTDIGNVTEKL